MLVAMMRPLLRGQHWSITAANDGNGGNSVNAHDSYGDHRSISSSLVSTTGSTPSTATTTVSTTGGTATTGSTMRRASPALASTASTATVLSSLMVGTSSSIVKKGKIRRLVPPNFLSPNFRKNQGRLGPESRLRPLLSPGSSEESAYWRQLVTSSLNAQRPVVLRVVKLC